MCSCGCCVCVKEMEAGIVQRFGKYDKVLAPGLSCICFPMQELTARVSLKVRQIDVLVDTKTKDNVFVKVTISVMYKIVESKVTTAYYKLSDPTSQIRSYVFDVIRGSLPTMLLDDIFASKDDLTHAVRDRLSAMMSEYGIQIITSLLADIRPDGDVKNAMNEINAQMRLREAMSYKADAEKIMQVKAAEAEAESKYLSGMGVARQRKAIVEGLKDTVSDFTGSVAGTGAQGVMDLLLLTQYFDVLRDIAKKSNAGGPPHALFLPHGPQSVAVLKRDLSSFNDTSTKNK